MRLDKKVRGLGSGYLINSDGRIAHISEGKPACGCVGMMGSRCIPTNPCKSCKNMTLPRYATLLWSIPISSTIILNECSSKNQRPLLIPNQRRQQGRLRFPPFGAPGSQDTSTSWLNHPPSHFAINQFDCLPYRQPFHCLTTRLNIPHLHVTDRNPP